MFFKNCGKEVDANAVACMGCGCNPKKGNKFCANCGTEVTNSEQIVCLKCGLSLTKGGKTSQNGAGGEKSKVVAALLALFLGPLGIHKFYLGKKVSGIIMLVLSLTYIGLPFTVIISFIEGIIYLMKSAEDFTRIYVEGNKSWF